MTQMPAASTPANPALRQALVRAIVAALILGAGVAAVRGLESMLNGFFDKPPAPLSRPLPEISRTLGERYAADGPDEVLNGEIVENLGTTDYLVRRYRDTSLPAGARGSRVNLNLNYYATGSSTPHVPEVCWKGAGMEEAPVSRRTFIVSGVQHKGGQISDLVMKMISFVPAKGPATSESGQPIYCNVAYVFHVNGTYVAATEEVTSLFWKPSNRYAYHAKIEVTPLEGEDILVCTQEEAQRIIGDFIRQALPEVEACLPDPSILTGSAETPSGKQR